MTQQPLATYSHEWKVLPQSIAEIAPTKPAAEAPEGMVRIPGGDFVFKVRGTEIEGGRRSRRRCAVSVGGLAAPFSRAQNGD